MSTRAGEIANASSTIHARRVGGRSRGWSGVVALLAACGADREDALGSSTGEAPTATSHDGGSGGGVGDSSADGATGPRECSEDDSFGCTAACAVSSQCDTSQSLAACVEACVMAVDARSPVCAPVFCEAHACTASLDCASFEAGQAACDAAFAERLAYCECEDNGDHLGGCERVCFGPTTRVVVCGGARCSCHEDGVLVADCENRWCPGGDFDDEAEAACCGW